MPLIIAPHPVGGMKHGRILTELKQNPDNGAVQGGLVRTAQRNAPKS
jgi:hypothetical protein